MIYIVDHGSQYTGLIAKKINSLNTRTKVLSPRSFLEVLRSSKKEPRGVIISGSPKTISQDDLGWGREVLPELKKLEIPTLGICFGYQLIALHYGSELKESLNREYGSAVMKLSPVGSSSSLFKNIPSHSQVWMSHSHSVLPSDSLEVLATSDGVASAFNIKGERIFGVLHHPEVYHSEYGDQLLKNFLGDCRPQVDDGAFDWASFVDEQGNKVKDVKKIMCAVSGGVDSTVMAVLLSKYCEVHAIYVDHGLQRAYDLEDLKKVFGHHSNIQLHLLDESERFIGCLHDIQDPEEKRKLIGKSFIEAFAPYAQTLGIEYFAQGTIASDVIESGQNEAKTAQKIKSHHNVGGLPDHLPFTLVEPLRCLYKDQVRSLGVHLGIPSSFIKRHPFPGPGLAIRCLGPITKNRIQKLREADDIFHTELRRRDLYHKTWQAGVILLPVKSTGVMGDENSYEECLVIRMVDSIDAMTAEATEIPWQDLKEISRLIINRVKGINRVVYDVTSKPPATIEWE